jgi:TldD protein
VELPAPLRARPGDARRPRPREAPALLERAAAAAHAFDPRVVKVEASLAEEIREILVVTSDGKIARDTQPLVRFGVRVIAEKDGKRQEGSSGRRRADEPRLLRGKSPEWHAREAARQAITDARRAGGAGGGQMEVVLAPGDSGILLHEAVGHGLEADFNRKGTSNYAGKIGEPVASDLCTVVDDATLLQSRGTINVDDEGNEPRAAVLIEKGKLVDYMHDRLSAEHYKRAPERQRSARELRLRADAADDEHDPDGRSARSRGDPAEREAGIYAKKFGGGQVDIANGDFVFSLTESYLVEDGKITAPLKGVNLIGNGPDVLRKVTMLGNDVEVSDGIWTCGKDGQSVPVGVGCPTIKISAITVGGTRLG